MTKHGQMVFQTMEEVERDSRRKAESARREHAETLRDAQERRCREREEDRRYSRRVALLSAVVSGVVGAALGTVGGCLVSRHAGTPEVQAEPEQQLDGHGHCRSKCGCADDEPPVVLGIGKGAVAGVGEDSELHAHARSVREERGEP